jgi:hypothetical protein
MPRWTLALLEPLADALSPPEEAVYLKGLCDVGRIGDFGARWEQTGRLSETEIELGLYRAAYLAGWGPLETAPAARARLAEVARDAKLGVLASRLQLSVAAKLLDAEAFAEALSWLERSNVAGGLDLV